MQSNPRMSLNTKAAPGAQNAEQKAAATAADTDRGLALANGIGYKLRQRRKVRQLSLSEVAGRAGLSIGLLSQIERGLSTPSLDALNRIGEALEMPLRWLFDIDDPSSAGEATLVVRRANRRRMDLGYAGMTKEILSSDAVPQLQLMHFTIRPGGKSGDSPNQHSTGAKAGTVIAGRLGLEVNGREYLLEPGDSFSFVATSRYRFWCAGETDCEVFWAVTPAIY